MSLLDTLLFPLAFAAALGCGLIAGTFFAFSNFVMKALARVPAERGIAAMQSINVVVLNPLFLGVFVGTAALCLVLAALALMRWSQPAAAWLLNGSVLYLLGNLFVTRAFNIPLNDALAQLDPSAVESATAWQAYVRDWTHWNHVRTVTALLGAAAFTCALCRMAATRA
jgi:uncharacterized membrane protein